MKLQVLEIFYTPNRKLEEETDESKKKIIGFAHVVVGDEDKNELITLYGYRVVNTLSGYIVSPPSRKRSGDGKYLPFVEFTDKQVIQDIVTGILEKAKEGVV